MTEPIDVDELSPGDEVLWGNRKQPLTVLGQEVNIAVNNPSLKDKLTGVVVESQQGTTYIIHESLYGRPKVKREVTPSADYPNGTVSEGFADDLRRV